MSLAYPPSVAWGVPDPTRTLVLRRQFSAQMTRRFTELKGRVNAYMSLVPGLKGGVLPMAAQEYSDIPLIVETFIRNLEQWESETVLEELMSPGLLALLGWTYQFTNAAYSRGTSKAASSLVRFLEAVADAEAAVGAISGDILFRERLRLLGGLTFSSLEGITSAMNTEILRTITEGFIQGKTRRDIASAINNRIDKIGLTRARRLARTSIAKIFNEGSVDAYLRYSAVLGDEILGEYITAGDSLVRPRHALRAGKLYLLEVIRTLFGEPNCRCTFAPVVLSAGQVIPIKRFGPVNPLRLAA